MANPTNKGYFVELNHFSILLARSSSLLSPFSVEDIREVPLDNKAGLEEAVQAIFPETKTGTANVFAALRPKQHGFHLSSADEGKKFATLATLAGMLTEPALAGLSPCEYTAVYTRGGLPISGQGAPWLLAAAAKESYAQALSTLQELKLVPTHISPATLSAVGGLASALKLKGDGSTALLFEFGESCPHLLLVSGDGVEAVRPTALTMDKVAEVVQAELGLKFKGSAAKLFFNEAYDFSETGAKIGARLAQELTADIGALGRTPAAFACTGLPAKQSWFASHLAGALNLAPFAPDLKSWCTQIHLAFPDGALESSLTPAWLGFLHFISSYQAASPEKSVWQPDWTRTTPAPAPAAAPAPTAPAAVIAPPKPAPASVIAPPKSAGAVPPAVPAKPPLFTKPGVAVPPGAPARTTPPLFTPTSLKPAGAVPPAAPAKPPLFTKPGVAVPPAAPAKPTTPLFTPTPPKEGTPAAPALPVKPAATPAPAPVKQAASPPKPIAAPPPRPIAAPPPRPIVGPTKPAAAATPPKPAAAPAPARPAVTPTPAKSAATPALTSKPFASSLSGKPPTRTPKFKLPALFSAKPNFAKLIKGTAGKIALAAAALVIIICFAYAHHQKVVKEAAKIEQQRREAEEAEKAKQIAEQKAQEVAAIEKAQEEAEARLAAVEAQAKLLEAKAADERRKHLAAARGQINIATEPAGATISIGDLPPRTSPALFTDLKLGNYPVTITLTDFEPTKLNIEVKENETTDPGVVKLAHLTGSLELTSEPPGASYSVRSANNTLVLNTDGLTGTTPATLNGLPSGDYVVTFSSAGFQSHSETVSVSRDNPAQASWKFINGNVLVTSTPSGATVRASDGRALGVTPVTINDVQPGDVSYILSLDGYDPATLSGKVEGGKTTTLSSTLLSVNRLAKLSDLDAQPQAIEEPQPQLNSRISDSGVVEISVTVDRSGNTRDLEVVKNTTNNQKIAQLCLDAVAQWKFKPGLIDDKPVNVRVTVPFTINP
ncbi:MAG TPA: TonB family protein [Opitutaceae bacterium]|nr:TonB family protein [Opitutaceae bacterium]